jgi:hypothetical protein
MKYTEQVMKLDSTTKIETMSDPVLKTNLNIVLTAAKEMGIDVAANFEQIQRVLIQSYILNE